MQWLNEVMRYFDDPGVDEVILNGPARASLQHPFGNQSLELSIFSDAIAMIDALQDFAADQGLRLDPIVPAAGGSLESGYRWHAILPPVAPQGPIFSLRRHRFASLASLTFAWLHNAEAKLNQLVADGEHLIFCGPTASGKTTLLAKLLAIHAFKERVLLLEELREIPELSPCWLSLLSRVPDLEGSGEVKISDLFRQGLRLRPDRIVFGELRGKEASSFLDCILSGHRGCMATMHATNAAAAKMRLINLAGRKYQEHLGESSPIWCVTMARGVVPGVLAVERM